MKYSRFEELPVWKDAIELAVRVFAFTANPVFRRYPGVRDQMERASVSVSNNIAEGFERGTTNELLRFLYISRGSCGEARSVLWLCHYLPGFENLRSQISDQQPRRFRVKYVPGVNQHKTPTFEAAILNRTRAETRKRSSRPSRA